MVASFQQNEQERQPQQKWMLATTFITNNAALLMPNESSNSFLITSKHAKNLSYESNIRNPHHHTHVRPINTPERHDLNG